MTWKQSTIGEIIDSERDMFLKAGERYGEYFANASEFNSLLNGFIKSIKADRFLFAMFLSQVRKHSTLAFFSAVRLHHIQATMDLRQVLEAGACAAYAIANIDPKDFADVDEQGLLNASQSLTKKRYDWLDKHYPQGSAAIRRMKETINSSSAHANIIYSHNNFTLALEHGRFETPFFDIEDEFLVKTDLWQIANIVMGLMDLCYGVNAKLDVIKFTDDFGPRLKELEAQNNKLKTEMLNSDRLKRFKK